MTYRPEFTVGPKSPGVWKEVRRLEAEVEGFQAENAEIKLWFERAAKDMQGSISALQRALAEERAYAADLRERLEEKDAD